MNLYEAYVIIDNYNQKQPHYPIILSSSQVSLILNEKCKSNCLLSRSTSIHIIEPQIQIEDSIQISSLDLILFLRKYGNSSSMTQQSDFEILFFINSEYPLFRINVDFLQRQNIDTIQSMVLIQ
ncbi:hypothetical protein pb186bvf_003029 [Paramecium bursaria]